MLCFCDYRAVCSVNWDSNEVLGTKLPVFLTNRELPCDAFRILHPAINSSTHPLYATIVISAPPLGCQFVLSNVQC
jgi:hypothetical protein